MTAYFRKKQKLAAPPFLSEPLWVLHLSDISCHDIRYQFPPGRVFSRLEETLERFINSRQAAFPRAKGLSALFITGDLSYQCSAEVLEWVLEQIPRLLKLTGIAGSRIYVVPGEHDIYLKYIQDKDDEMRFPDPQTWNNFLAAERKGRSGKIGSRFTVYHEFLLQLGREHGTRVPSAASDIFYADVFSHQDWQVAVLGLNSAWSCTCRLNDDRGALYLGMVQAEEVGEMARKLNRGQLPSLVLSLLHHPLEWFTPSDRPALQRLMETTHLFFRGHLHAGGQWAEAGERKIPVLSTSVWCGEELLPGFLIAAIDPAARKVYVWPFLWSAKQQSFMPVIDSTTPSEGRSCFEFSFP